MDDIEHEQNQGLEELHLVAHQKDCDHDKVQQDEDRFTSYNPPVDQSLPRHNQVKYTCTLQQLSQPVCLKGQGKGYLGNLLWTMNE